MSDPTSAARDALAKTIGHLVIQASERDALLQSFSAKAEIDRAEIDALRQQNGLLEETVTELGGAPGTPDAAAAPAPRKRRPPRPAPAPVDPA